MREEERIRREVEELNRFHRENQSERGDDADHVFRKDGDHDKKLIKEPMNMDTQMISEVVNPRKIAFYQ